MLAAGKTGQPYAIPAHYHHAIWATGSKTGMEWRADFWVIVKRKPLNICVPTSSLQLCSSHPLKVKVQKITWRKTAGKHSGKQMVSSDLSFLYTYRFIADTVELTKGNPRAICIWQNEALHWGSRMLNCTMLASETRGWVVVTNATTYKTPPTRS